MTYTDHINAQASKQVTTLQQDLARLTADRADLIAALEEIERDGTDQAFRLRAIARAALAKVQK